MTAVQINILQTLSAGGQRADALASVVCRLVTEGAELGALEERQIIGADGVLVRTVKLIPRVWLERLDRAVDVGALERMSVTDIVDRILGMPLPEHVETEAT
jgi:hypothetical protein